MCHLALHALQSALLLAHSALSEDIFLVNTANELCVHNALLIVRVSAAVTLSEVVLTC